MLKNKETYCGPHKHRKFSRKVGEERLWGLTVTQSLECFFCTLDAISNACDSSGQHHAILSLPIPMSSSKVLPLFKSRVYPQALWHLRCSQEMSGKESLRRTHTSVPGHLSSRHSSSQRYTVPSVSLWTVTMKIRPVHACKLCWHNFWPLKVVLSHFLSWEGRGSSGWCVAPLSWSSLPRVLYQVPGSACEAKARLRVAPM